MLIANKFLTLLFLTFSVNGISQVYPAYSRLSNPKIYDSLLMSRSIHKFDSIIFYKQLHPVKYPKVLRISYQKTYDSLKRIGKQEQLDSIIHVRKKMSIIRKLTIRDSLFDIHLVTNNFYLRFTFPEFGFGWERPKNYAKKSMIEYSVGYRLFNAMDSFGIIPELMSNYLLYCRQNQKRGINFRIECKKYFRKQAYTFIGYALETGCYWTPSGTPISTSYDNGYYEPQYEIYRLNSFRAGLNFSCGWVGKNTGIKLYAGVHSQYYFFEYKMTRGTYYIQPTGEMINENGLIWIWPTVRLMMNVKLNR